MKLIYLIAGEASGDMLGANLMRALKTEAPDIQFAGIGGEMMQEEGLVSLFPYHELSVMGFLEVVPHIPKFLRLLRETFHDIADKKPDMVITIDSPGFNFRLAKMLQEDERTTSIKRVHYVAPSVWAYRPERAQKTAELFDLLLTLLPFEPAYFEREGLVTVFVGHPVLWEENRGDANAFRARHNLESGEKLLLILPGSRAGEVKRHLPIFLEAAKTLPEFRLAIIASPQVKPMIENVGLPANAIVCDIHEKYDAFAAATLALSKSGTITLELAEHGVPTVVAHKVSAVSAWLYRRVRLIKLVSLANIAVNKEIVPELLQESCTAGEIAKALHELTSSDAMWKQRKEVKEAIKSLRGGNPSSPGVMAAKAILG